MKLSRAAARARARMRRRVRPSRPHVGRAPAAAPPHAAEPSAVAAGLEEDAAARVLTHAEVRTVFFGLMLAAFLSALNQTIIATALPTIGRAFFDFENLPWIVTAYLLTSTAVAPLYGKLSDIFGRRSMMLLAIGLFIAGSAV